MGRGLRLIGRALGAAGRATVALVGICGVVAALANYTMTQGSGTTFGSIIVGGIHYIQTMVCDPTTPANCGGVKAGNTAVIADVAQVVSDPNVLAAINNPIPLNKNGTATGQTGVTPGTAQTGTIVGANVDLTSINGTATPVGSGVQATALRTTLATDSPGIVTLGQTTKSASVPVTIASDQYVDPCQSPNIAKSSVPINLTSAAGTTSLVAVSGATVVYVCGLSFTIAPSATTADSILFEYGTGAACTGPVALTGTFGSGDVTTAAPLVTVNYGGAGSTIFKSAASNGVCALTAGTVINIQGVLTYVQQ